MAKAEISWRRKTPDGENLQCYAQHFGNKWLFYSRLKRFDQWQHIEDPPLEDWLELLDSVRRRINRRLQRPETEGKLMKLILDRYPDADVAAK